MRTAHRTLIIVVTAVALVTVASLRQSSDSSLGSGSRSSSATTQPAGTDGLPRLISLGAGKCVPCKAMEPIREQLRTEFAGRLVVEYHDVWEDRSFAEKFRIRVIPTLVYVNPAGEEVARTEGYRNREQILEVFREHGMSLDTAPIAGS